MPTNLDRYKKDLDQLVSDGDSLLHALEFQCYPEKFKKKAQKIFKGNTDIFLKELPDFNQKYQNWYSEGLAIVKLLLPDRVNDFVKLYEKPKGRKQITCENYTIEDCLHGLSVTKGFTGEKIVDRDAAIPLFTQQLNILKSTQKRFESSLFNLKQLVQADLFDSELDAAHALNKNGFSRGAGAMAGVVLEAHLSQVCENHKLTVTKTDPTINDLNQLLKNSNVIEIHNWRFIQHLADLRNLCDHDKKREPTKEEIEELINGVIKVIKTIF